MLVLFFPAVLLSKGEPGKESMHVTKKDNVAYEA